MERNKTTTVVALHGFLGSSSDFASLNQYVTSSEINLFSLNIKPSIQDFCYWDQLVEKVSRDINVISNETTTEAIIMGYSMGGRLVLDMLQNNLLQHFHKIVFISSHMSLYSEKEAQQKEHFNQKSLEKITIESDKEFLRYWNNLELFANDKPLTEHDWTKQDMEHYFNHWAHPTPRHMPLQLLEAQKVYYVNGSKDFKYQLQAQNLKTELPEVKHLEISGRGHRLLETQDLKQILNFIL